MSSPKGKVMLPIAHPALMRALTVLTDDPLALHRRALLDLRRARRRARLLRLLARFHATDLSQRTNWRTCGEDRPGSVTM